MNSKLRDSMELRYKEIKAQLMETTSTDQLKAIKQEMVRLRYECAMAGYIDIVRDLDRILR